MRIPLQNCPKIHQKTEPVLRRKAEMSSVSCRIALARESHMMGKLGEKELLRNKIMPGTWKLLQHTSNHISFAAGQVIFKQGDVGDFMLAVQEGEVEIRLHDQVVEIVETGGILGELAIIYNRPR